MAQPIPVNGLRRLNAHAGTAFVVSNGIRKWLVTCAHIITGIDNAPATEDYFSEGQIKIVGTGLYIPLYESGQKRFNIVHNATYNAVVDALSIELRPAEALVLQSFGAFDLSRIVSIKIGDQVTMIGFPGLQQVPIKSSVTTATVLQVADINFMISKPSKKGYSGGPVFTENGLVGIATGDVGKDELLTNGLAVSLSVLAPIIFR